MDPALLAEVNSSLEELIKSTRDIIDKLDTLDFVAQQQFSSVGAFKRSVKYLSIDAAMIQEKIRPLIIPDEGSTMTSILDSAAIDKSLQQLRDVVRRADVTINLRLRDFFPASTSVSLGPNDVPSSSEILGFARLRAFDSVLGTDVVGLAGLRAEIWQLFQEFFFFFEIHDTFKQQFFYQPFNITIERLYGLQLYGSKRTLRFNRTWVDRYSLVMDDMGRLWVKANIPVVTVPSITRTQIKLLQWTHDLIDRELASFKSAYPETETHLSELNMAIEKEVEREGNKKFVIAFCGMVKAGKSLFLNALTGRSMLPSDELPSTAWPCRLRHVPGQEAPKLQIDTAYFQIAIDRLKAYKYGAMMEDYSVSKDTDPFLEVLGLEECEEDAVIDIGQAASDLNDLNRKREIYNNWVDLHPMTKANLLRFEEEDYRIPAVAEGEERVLDLLTKVNDIVRLCRRMNVTVPKPKPQNWPLLEVEFHSLRGRSVDGDFEFIDLPGIGESSCGDFYVFEDLVRLVAKEANAIVPIVSFKEVSKDDWRQQLPEIIKTGLGRAPDLVLCTHLDQVAKDRVDQLVASVASVFWPNSTNSQHRVMCCSSRMGMSARALLRLSCNEKPKFEDIWSEDNDAYDCAEKILGVGNPEIKYTLFELAEWREAIEEQMQDSRLESAVRRLTRDIVHKEHGHILRVEGEQLRRRVSKILSDQQRLILGMGRTQKELQMAYHGFREARSQLKQVLAEWGTEESRMDKVATAKLERAFQLLETKGLAIAGLSIEKTVNQPHWQKKTERGDTTLVFRHKADIDTFLLSIQNEMRTSLDLIKREFVTFVRELAHRARVEYFESLKSKIRITFKDTTQSDLVDGITEKLASYSSTSISLLLPVLKKKVVHKVVTKRHTPSSAFHAIENAIARPLMSIPSQPRVGVMRIGSPSSEVSSDVDSAGTSERELEQLGFLLRAPLAVVASIPWFFGSGVWFFMAQTKSYVLNKDALRKELEAAVRPYFQGLKDEGDKSMKGMRSLISQVAHQAVDEALTYEKSRFKHEMKQKQQPRSPELMTASMTIMLNLLGCESGLLELQSCLNKAEMLLQ